MRVHPPTLDGIFQKAKVKKVILSCFGGSLIFLFLITFPSGTFLIADGNFLRTFVREGNQCVPKHHIMYLKTHKCSSSTLQNVFLRYGLRNNLTFALPLKGNYLGNPYKFKPSMIPKSLMPKSGVVDMFCVHSRLDAAQMRRVLHPDSVWITVVRDPVTLFESLFNYFHLKYIYNMSLETLGETPLTVLKKFSRTPNRKFGRNQLLFDLGADENISEEALTAKVKELDLLFDAVLVSERMDESLVLLRHKLCWSLEEVVGFTKNARRSTTKKALTKRTVAKIRELNAADVIVYDHFLRRHSERVSMFGLDKMRDEVAALRALREESYEECVQTEVNGRDSRLQFKEYSAMVNSFLLHNDTDEICQTLTMPELPFIDLVRRRQETALRKTTVGNEMSKINHKTHLQMFNKSNDEKLSISR